MEHVTPDRRREFSPEQITDAVRDIDNEDQQTRGKAMDVLLHAAWNKAHSEAMIAQGLGGKLLALLKNRPELQVSCPFRVM